MPSITVMFLFFFFFFLFLILNRICIVHRHNIIHRDIKPQNLIIANDATTIKLIDFGNATTLSDIQKDHVKRNNSLGSPAFMAPELLKKGSYFVN